jgi:hypothetical protein
MFFTLKSLFKEKSIRLVKKKIKNAFGKNLKMKFLLKNSF